MDLPDPNATLTYERIVELQNDLNERRRRALAYQLSRDDKAAVVAHFATLQHQLDVADRARKSAISEQGRNDRKGMGIDAQAERDAARRGAGGVAGAARGAAKGTEEAQSAKDGKSRIHDLTDMTFGEWGNQKKYGQVVSGNQRYLYARDDLGPDGKPTPGALPVNQIPESDWQDIVSSTFDRANRTLPQPIPADGAAPPVPGERLAPYKVQDFTGRLLAGIAPSRDVGPVTYPPAPAATTPLASSATPGALFANDFDAAAAPPPGSIADASQRLALAKSLRERAEESPTDRTVRELDTARKGITSFDDSALLGPVPGSVGLAKDYTMGGLRLLGDIAQPAFDWAFGGPADTPEKDTPEARAARQEEFRQALALKKLQEAARITTPGGYNAVPSAPIR